MSTATASRGPESADTSSTPASVTDRVKDMAHHAVEGVQEAGSSMKNAAEEKLEQLRDATAHAAETGREKAVELGHHVESYVRKEPAKCMVAAGALGFLIGMLILPRRL